jgi:hypothetical protein
MTRLGTAPIVNGKEAPFKTNWELLMAAEETVTPPPTALKKSTLKNHMPLPFLLPCANRSKRD